MVYRDVQFLEQCEKIFPETHASTIQDSLFLLFKIVASFRLRAVRDSGRQVLSQRVCVDVAAAVQ